MAKVKGKGKINEDADVGVEKEAGAANGTKNENLPVEEAAAASGVGLLSEEQTNAALAALQEASTMVIEAKEAEEAKSKEATCGDNNSNNDNSNKKRKAIDAAAAPQPKKRGPPVRVAWNDRMAMLLEYKETNGDLLIPIRYKVNPSLGKFVHNTREQYKLFHKKTPPGYKKKCSLTAERIAQLQDMGFLWTTERTKRQNEDWEVRLEQLREYKEKHGDCLVPHGYEEDPSFAEWIHRQRTAHASMEKEKEPNGLIAERMKKLEEINFNFTVHSDKWMDHWNMLKAYKERHGHVQVPTHFADNPKLGRWVHTQRHQRRLQLKTKKSCMTQERVDLLDKLGFSWEVRPSLERPRATWQQRMDELKEFHIEHKHFRVPSGTHPQLHSWCQEQRIRLRNLVKNKGKDVSKRMGPDRINQLAKIGFTKDVEIVDPNDKAAKDEPKQKKEEVEDATKVQEDATKVQEDVTEIQEEGAGTAATEEDVALAVEEAATTMEV